MECDKGRLGGWTQRLLACMEGSSISWEVVVDPRGTLGDPRAWHREAQGDPNWINHGQRSHSTASLPPELVVRLGVGPRWGHRLRKGPAWPGLGTVWA